MAGFGVPTMKDNPMNDREETLYGCLKKSKGRQLSVDELSDFYYDRRERPAHWRKSVHVIMSRLIAKTSSCEKPVRKTSAVGRGKKVTYSIDAK
jgi:hypothetical protein